MDKWLQQAKRAKIQAADTAQQAAEPTTTTEPLRIERDKLRLRMWHRTGLSCITVADIDREVEYLPREKAAVKVFDQWHEVARRVAAYGDPAMTYTYSALPVKAKPWTPILLQIKARVEELVGCKFNFVLVNRYKDGQDHIGRHRDREDELDGSAPIASVSFGAGRDFVLDRKGHSKVVLHLTHGCLVTMDPPTNQHWYHSVPSRAKVTTPRINLTFRRIVARAEEPVGGPVGAPAASDNSVITSPALLQADRAGEIIQID